MASATKLPGDIISEIFQYFIPVEVLQDSPFILEERLVLRALRDVVTLSHVCSAWRQMSFYTLQLWNAVFLPIWDDGEDAGESYVQPRECRLFRLTNEWISRASPVPKLLCIFQRNRNALRRRTRLGVIQELFAKHMFQSLWIQSRYKCEVELS